MMNKYLITNGFLLCFVGTHWTCPGAKQSAFTDKQNSEF